jgi:hypothetical protein
MQLPHTIEAANRILAKRKELLGTTVEQITKLVKN